MGHATAGTNWDQSDTDPDTGADVWSQGRQLREDIAVIDGAQKYIHMLGPMPEQCIAALADLGLTDTDIGRYFKMPSGIITKLRQVWRIDGIV